MKTNAFFFFFLFDKSIRLVGCQKQSPEISVQNGNSATLQADRIKHGEYLVSILACHDCHTPKKMTDKGPDFDFDRTLMGHPAEEIYVANEEKRKMIETEQVSIMNPGFTGFAGPWGVSYAANLTPDDTGIGTWSEAQFFKAIRDGKSKGLDSARDLVPPMPWQVYRNLSDEDLRSVFAYLKSLKPIKNVVPNPRSL